MSTADRKARKRAGIRFEHPVKVGTPRGDRAVFVEARDRAASRRAEPFKSTLFRGLLKVPARTVHHARKGDSA